MENKYSFGFGHYFAVIRRRWLAIVALTVLGALLAVGYLLITPVSATVSTLVNVNLIVSDPFNPSKPSSALMDAATESQLASSYEVAKAAAATLPAGGDNLESLRDGVVVSTNPEATTLRITYTAASPALARSGADAIANAYLDYRQDQAETRKLKLQKQLDEQLGVLSTRLKGASDAQASALLTQIGSVQSRLNALSLIDTDGGTVLNPAAESPVIFKPGVPLVVATGLFAGFALGLVLAFVVNMLDRRVRDGYDVRAAGAGSVLAKLHSTVAHVPATGTDQDDFRVIRERLLADVDRPARVLAVVDNTVGPPSDVAINLAVAFAQSGTDVSLILMGVTGEHSALLSEGLELSTVDFNQSTVLSRSASMPTLTVLQTESEAEGTGADDLVTELVHSEVRELRYGDLVILALPPNAPRASRLAVGRLADTVLLVAECQRTGIDRLAAQASEVAEVHATLAGTVLVPAGRHLEPKRTAPRSHRNNSDENARTEVGADSR